MNATQPTNSLVTRRLRLSNLAAPASALALGLWAGGCMKSHPSPVTSGSSAGTILDQPDPTIGSQTFVVDENHGGQGNSVHIRALLWGRLVSVRDITGPLQNSDMV